MDCGPLDDPANGLVQYALTTLGAIAVYTCDNGYMTVGGSSRVCETDGDWSGSNVTCERKTILLLLSCLMHFFLSSYFSFSFNFSLLPSFPSSIFLQWWTVESQVQYLKPASQSKRPLMAVLSPMTVSLVILW